MNTLFWKKNITCVASKTLQNNPKLSKITRKSFFQRFFAKVVKLLKRFNFSKMITLDNQFVFAEIFADS